MRLPEWLTLSLIRHVAAPAALVPSERTLAVASAQIGFGFSLPPCHAAALGSFEDFGRDFVHDGWRYSTDTGVEAFSFHLRPLDGMAVTTAPASRGRARGRARRRRARCVSPGPRRRAQARWSPASTASRGSSRARHPPGENPHAVKRPPKAGRPYAACAVQRAASSLPVRSLSEPSANTASSPPERESSPADSARRLSRSSMLRCSGYRVAASAAAIFCWRSIRADPVVEDDERQHLCEHP